MDSLTNTELAILGLVAEHPKYGYQIEQDIAERGMREWTEIGFSSIYYVLNRLEAASWLASEQVSAGGVESAQGKARDERRAGPPRKVYHLTQAGWGGYRAAVGERLAHPRPRTGDFDLALANLPALSPVEVRAALETYRASLEKRLAQVREKWSADRAAVQQSGLPFPSHVEALFEHSVVGLEAELEWVIKYLRS